MSAVAVETTPLTRQERQLRLLLGVFTILFGLTTVSFLVEPWNVGRRLAWIGRFTGFANTTPPAPGGPWLALAVSMMTMITVICAMAWSDVRRYRPLLPLLLVSKAASSLVGLAYFLFADRSFHYFVVFTTDFPIFLLTLVLYLRAAPSRRP